MYEDFFGLNELPFNVTPDPRFVYMSRHHRAALSSMQYGVQSRRGFMQITGEIGAGKTTLSRMLLSQLGRKTHTSLVFNPGLSHSELLQAIVEDFGIRVKSDKTKAYFDALNKFLLQEVKKGYNALVIIDEGQLLTAESLEQVRLLSNLETTTQKLLQIILMGQPELKDLINKPELTQLRQRIAIRYHLPALPADEVGYYLGHRLRVAGCHDDVFSPLAVNLIAEISGGVPRVINILADRAMLAAYVRQEHRIDEEMVDCAQNDIQGVAV